MSEETKNNLNSVPDDKKLDFDKCLEAAEQGDAEAQYIVGKCYLTGEGTEKNKIIAFRWFKKSAEQGHAKALYETGLCYLEGKGAKVESLEWYKKAAEQGYAKAQYKVGNAYYSGKGVEKDKTEAFKWFLLAAEQGDSDAQYMVGKCYYNGNGVKENKTEAFKWYKKASEQENFSNKLSNGKFIENVLKIFAVQFGLGKCYWNGAGVPVNEDEAFKCWGRAVLTVLKLSVIGIPAIALPVLILFFIVSLLGNVYSATIPKLIEKAKRPYYDYVMCEEVRKENHSRDWQRYLEKFPDGRCADEALASIKDEAAIEITARDEELCATLHKNNTRTAWERYLREFPDGKCADEGKVFKNKYKKTGNVKWSNVYNNDDSFYSWRLAEQYCKDLDEDGHKDWRLPTIDELEVLVENCSKTKEKGECLFGKMNGGVDEYNHIFAYSDDESAMWYADNSGIHMEDSDLIIGGVSIRCVREDDHDACETAKKYNKPYFWIFYFENFPNGECAAEAKAVWEKEEEKACLEARKENSRAIWEQYLKTFPNGKCVKEGKSVRNKFKKIAGLEWSDRSTEVVSPYYVSGDYCENLREDGHDDWFLPYVEELRMLVQNHSTTIADGSCNEYAVGFVSDNCRGENGNNFSKLGDRVKILSSSAVQGYRGKYLDGLGLDFSNGGIFEIYGEYSYFRCARIIDNDIEACNSVRKDPSFHAWSLYLHNFPKGKCAKEAKKAMDSISCKKAVSTSDWEDYLKDFPHGKCASEAKMIVEVDSCRKAMEENSRAGWEAYLRERDFPNGRCSYEGKVFVNQYRKIGGLEWSDVSVADDGYFGEVSRYSWEEADSYCKELKEGGHRDWRLPTVDELKMIIRNCPKTESENDEYESDEVKEESEENDGAEEGTSLENVCLYSRLQGDNDEFGLWAYHEDGASLLYADIDGIHEDNYYTDCSVVGGCHSVRCVR